MCHLVPLLLGPLLIGILPCLGYIFLLQGLQCPLMFPQAEVALMAVFLHLVIACLVMLVVSLVVFPQVVVVSLEVDPQVVVVVALLVEGGILGAPTQVLLVILLSPVYLTVPE